MTAEQFARQRDYGAGLAVAKEMLTRGFIFPEEYEKLATTLYQNYRPVIGYSSA